MNEPAEFLDIKQAAQLLNVSETSLRRWTNAGQLASLRVGRKRERRFRREDLLAFMEAHPTPGGVDRDRRSRSLPPQHTVIGGIPVPFGSHLCGLYASEPGRTKLAAGFLADGLHPDSVCYLVAELDARDQILAHLEQNSPSLQSDIHAGRLVLSEYAASWRAQHDYFEARFVAAARSGAHSLRVVGDVSGGVAKWLTQEEVIGYEASYDQLLARRFPVVTLCQYDVRRCTGAEVLNLLKAHQDTFRYPVERLLA